MKISIIGCGNVGSAVAFSLILKGGVDEIILIDIDDERMEGERLDLLHTITPKSIKRGDLQDTTGSEIIVITAGIRRGPGESRLDLTKRNAKIIDNILDGLPKDGDPIIFVVSNPVDILTHLVARRRDPRRVIGLGTFLDTSRFRFYLSETLCVLPSLISGFVLGEHGDSMVVIWSHVGVGGVPLQEFRDLSNEEKERIIQRTKKTGSLLNEKKGGANWGVAISILRVIEALACENKSILPISSLVSGYYGIDGVCLSVPTILSKKGVEGYVRLKFNDEEIEGLMNSAKILKEAIEDIY